MRPKPVREPREGVPQECAYHSSLGGNGQVDSSGDRRESGNSYLRGTAGSSGESAKGGHSAAQNPGQDLYGHLGLAAATDPLIDQLRGPVDQL